MVLAILGEAASGAAASSGAWPHLRGSMPNKETQTPASPVTIVLGRWKVELEVGHDGRLCISVPHPGGGPEVADIDVSEDLVVTGDHQPPTQEEIEVLMATFRPEAEPVPVPRQDLELARRDPNAATQMVRHYQGMVWRNNRWEAGFNKPADPYPHPVRHAAAVAALERL